jgi:hypothetical protein
MATIWFESILICLILEGSYFGTAEGSIINNLSFFTSFQVGNLFSVPVFNLNFFQGLFQLLTWDYSFYTGYYAILRWFWMTVLTPGVIWGLAQVFIMIYGQIINLFRLLPI